MLNLDLKVRSNSRDLVNLIKDQPPFTTENVLFYQKDNFNCFRLILFANILDIF